MSRHTLRVRMCGRLAGMLLVISTCAAGCDSPLGPDGFTLAGDWTGTWEFVAGGAVVTDTISATMSQNEASAAGTWTAASGPSGALTLTPRSMTSGTVSITQITLLGQTCSATTSATGTASGEMIEIVLADLPPGGACTWATNQRFSLTRAAGSTRLLFLNRPG